jgi:hypothetical protein
MSARSVGTKGENLIPCFCAVKQHTNGSISNIRHSKGMNDTSSQFISVMDSVNEINKKTK